MGRKNLTEERKVQILDAFEQCIVEGGLESATLQRIADTAGVNLGMIHHCVGKRDDLLKALVDRVLQKTQDELKTFRRLTLKRGRLNKLIDAFFSSQETSSPTSRILNELIKATEKDELVRELVHQINTEFIQTFAEEIQNKYPHLETSNCEHLGYVLISMLYGGDLLSGIGVHGDSRKKLSHFAKQLVKQWGEPN